MLRKFLSALLLLIILSSCSHAMTYNVINSSAEAPGSLAWAVNNVNALGGDGHIIEFDESVKSIKLAKELTITAGVKIYGEGVCITGSGNSRLFTITNGKTEFDSITFTKGYAIENNGGAVNIEGPEAGAEFTNCTFYDNAADMFGGAVCITNADEKNFVVFTHCTIAGNDAKDGGGVAIIKGDAKIFASIITGNTDDEIYTGSKATLAGSNNILGEYAGSLGENNLTGQKLSEVLVTDSEGNAKLESVNDSMIIKLAGTSPARDFIEASNITADIDEAGTPRPQLNAYDAGAFEALPVPVELVKIDGTPYMQVNTIYNFSVDVFPLDASINFEDYPPEGVVWRSDNENVITIDNAGKATALNTGEAYITAEVHGWDSDGKKNVKISAEELLVKVGTDALGARRATLYGLENLNIAQKEYRDIKPEVVIEINDMEVENAKYSLTAESSRPEILDVKIVSGDTVRFHGSSEQTGEVYVRVTARPLPDGDGTYKDITVNVVKNSGILARSSKSSSGGCNSGFGSVFLLLSGAYIAVLMITKFGRVKSSEKGA